MAGCTWSASDRDRYGRLLRYVWTVEVESVDQTLITEGLARAVPLCLACAAQFTRHVRHAAARGR